MNKLEPYLNRVIGELCNGLAELAEKVKRGANREELANEMDALAVKICEHWPNCFTEMKARQKAKPKPAPKPKPKPKPTKAKPASKKS